ncbi:MAG: alpha/beta hydrolase [Bacteroidia bacterium]|nr:alpha/beta hydrolase [Bacteroidia bacterium]
MFSTTKDGLNLYYETHSGNSDAPTLVFLNGLSQSTIAWVLTNPHLKGYNIVNLDFIFQGKSDKTGEARNFDQHAADVAGVLNDLGVETAVIAGLSYGSLVAQHFALLYPEKTEKLVLMSSFCHKTPYYDAIELAWWKALQIGGYSLLLDVMLPTVLSEAYFQNPLIPIELMKAARQESNEDAAALLKLMTATKERKDFRDELKKIKTPTLVIHGEKDLLFPIHMGMEVAKNISGSQFEIILGAGHTLNLEAVPQMSLLIKKFVGMV